jgi:hypothetical protein
MASIQGIYIALFGRPADPAGLAFWTEATKGGQDLSALTAMTQTPEYLNRFAGKTPEEIVTAIYQSLFGRAPDAGGLEFFVNALENGSLDTIAIQILDGAQGSDAVIIDNKEAAADLFTASLDTPEEIAAYSGENAIQNAQNLLSEVTEDPASIPTTQDIDAAIQTLDQPPEEQNEEEETPPVGGGGGGGPTTTFTVLVDDDDQVTFGGNATGDITVVDGQFVRAGIAVAVPSDIASIILGAGDKLVANAGFLDGLAISGGTVGVLTPNVLETTENFTNAISLEDSSTAVDGKWYIDRYAPDSFAVVDNELVQTISSDDRESERGAQSGTFYNTQGRAYDLRDGTTAASITLAIDTNWSTTLGDNARVAGFWGVGRDATGAVSFYPIVEYARVDGDGVLKFWTASGFSATTVPVSESVTSIDIGFRLNQDGTFTYTVNGDDKLTTSAPGTVEIGSVILQGHNDADGQDYSITWDDLTTSSNVPYDPSIDLSGITSEIVFPEVVRLEGAAGDAETTGPGIHWVTDRAQVDSISVADGAIVFDINQAGATSGFARYQGAKLEFSNGELLDLAHGAQASVDFIIDADWSADSVAQQSGVWVQMQNDGKTLDGGGRFSIVEYLDETAATALAGVSGSGVAAGTTSAGFRFWDSAEGWHDFEAFAGTGAVSLVFDFGAAKHSWSINGVETFVDTGISVTQTSVLETVIVNSQNFGSDEQYVYDNITLTGVSKNNSVYDELV